MGAAVDLTAWRSPIRTVWRSGIACAPDMAGIAAAVGGLFAAWFYRRLECGRRKSSCWCADGPRLAP